MMRNLTAIISSIFLVGFSFGPSFAETCSNGKVCPSGTRCGAANLFCVNVATGKVDPRPPAGSDSGAGQGADGKQCIDIQAGKDSSAWRVHNNCTFMVTALIQSGSSTRDKYSIGPGTYMGVISRNRPSVVSACAHGSDCK